MTAPAGAIVGLYVDLVARVAVNDIIETRSGRRYGVLAVRVQERGKHAGRQHLRAVVLRDGDAVICGGIATNTALNRRCIACGLAGVMCERRVHRIRWYRRKRGAGVKQRGRM